MKKWTVPASLNDAEKEKYLIELAIDHISRQIANCYGLKVFEKSYDMDLNLRGTKWYSVKIKIGVTSSLTREYSFELCLYYTKRDHLLIVAVEWDEDYWQRMNGILVEHKIADRIYTIDFDGDELNRYPKLDVRTMKIMEADNGKWRIIRRAKYKTWIDYEVTGKLDRETAYIEKCITELANFIAKIEKFQITSTNKVTVDTAFDKLSGIKITINGQMDDGRTCTVQTKVAYWYSPFMLNDGFELFWDGQYNIEGLPSIKYDVKLPKNIKQKIINLNSMVHNTTLEKDKPIEWELIQKTIDEVVKTISSSENIEITSVKNEIVSTDNDYYEVKLCILAKDTTTYRNYQAITRIYAHMDYLLNSEKTFRVDWGGFVVAQWEELKDENKSSREFYYFDDCPAEYKSDDSDENCKVRIKVNYPQSATISWIADSLLKEQIANCTITNHEFTCYFDKDSYIKSIKIGSTLGCCDDFVAIIAHAPIKGQIIPDQTIRFRLESVESAGSQIGYRVKWSDVC